jgi:acyl-CoA reductase-like NAD-dependent aldehyde dehydrogenase
MSDPKLLINGALRDGARYIDVINPATGAAFAICPVANQSLLEEAVAAAKAAFPAWSARPLADRASLLTRLADAMQAQAGEFFRRHEAGPRGAEG